MSGNEERLARLEEGLFFQERLLQDLNSALIGQQNQLDRMRNELNALRGKVLEMSALLDESGGTDGRPPHYQERYRHG